MPTSPHQYESVPIPNRDLPDDNTLRSASTVIVHHPGAHSGAAGALFNGLVSDVLEAQFRDGFFSAGDNLARDLWNQQYLTECDPPREFDGLWIVMTYCFRHFIEVSLKVLLRELAARDGCPPDEAMMSGHNLGLLWCTLRPRLLERDAENCRSTNHPAEKAIGRVVNYFITLDKSGAELRYFLAKDGSKRQVRGPALFKELVDAMRDVKKYFDARLAEVQNACEERIGDTEFGGA